ncbi:MAG: TraB/GumN family protein [Desulfuromonadales bacterium]|nr:TraB/GumN family protein [Desulfuromonadales bacterium]NIR33505.1 TraB/GumN family protein [Desulfuromonadales bacterium]NIS43536.1 TraB/GumN family protein [Desulfuromonadales bacterium]
MRTNQTVLVVVGAAHLVGSEGLLRLLQERGYRVEQQSRYRR